MIQFLTRTGILTSVMPRVYFCCHPDDFDSCFRTICSDIFAVQENCAIFYEDGLQEESDEDTPPEILNEVRLVIVPVTRRLLTTKNRALDTELPFAVKHNIAVLPILAEEGSTDQLIDTYDHIPVFSGIQFLNKYDMDRTALKYEDKLASFLRSVLVNEDDIQRIQEQFAARIFLSYRKKDRSSALELMKKIHEVDICRDTAIWYDEYLVPGESFDASIMQALDESDVFVMSVSQSFEEPNNYVAMHEYPDAVRKSKPLIAARMKRFDQSSLDNLEAMYPGINTLLVDPDDTDNWGVTLKQRLTEDSGISEEALLNNDGEHLYYIALAYKNGVRTEADPVRAAALFVMSAENGCEASYLRLIRMYRMGDGVEENLDTALAYCQQAIRRLTPFEGSSLEKDRLLATVFGEQGHIYEKQQQPKKALDAYKSAFQVHQKMHNSYNDAPFSDYCESMLNVARTLLEMGMCSDAVQFAENFISETNLWSEKQIGTNTEMCEDLSLLRAKVRLYSLLNTLYLQILQGSKAKSCFKPWIMACEQIVTKTGSIRDLKELANVYSAYADYQKAKDPNESNTYLEKYREIIFKLSEYEKDSPKTISHAIDTFRMAENAIISSIRSGKASSSDRAIALFKETLDICSKLEKECECDAMLLTAQVYERLGQIEETIKKSFKGAVCYYEKALTILKNLEKKHRNEIRILHLLSLLYDAIGAIYLKVDDLTHATQSYTDALEIDLRVSRINHDPVSMHHLAKSYLRCASVSEMRGHQAVADVNNRRALMILEALMEKTDDYRIIEDLAYVYCRLGMSERFTHEQRLDYFDKALCAYKRLMTITNRAEEHVRSYASVQELKAELS